MREIRASILEDRFTALYQARRATLDLADPEHPPLTSKPAKKKPVTLGAFGIHIAWEGFGSIVHMASGEIMHSRTRAERGGRAALRGAERAGGAAAGKRRAAGDLGCRPRARRRMRWRRSAAMKSRRPRGRCGRCEIVSFENDLDSLRLAFLRRELFPYLRHPAPDKLLHTGTGNRSTRRG